MDLDNKVKETLINMGDEIFNLNLHEFVKQFYRNHYDNQYHVDHIDIALSVGRNVQLIIREKRQQQLMNKSKRQLILMAQKCGVKNAREGTKQDLADCIMEHMK
jgi:hypothetical protein